MFFFCCLLWEFDDVSCLLDSALKLKGKTLLLIANSFDSFYCSMLNDSWISQRNKTKRGRNKMRCNWTNSQVIELLLKGRVIKSNLETKSWVLTNGAEINKGSDWNLKCSYGKWQLVKEIIYGGGETRNINFARYSHFEVYKLVDIRLILSNRTDPQCWFTNWSVGKLSGWRYKCDF